MPIVINEFEIVTDPQQPQPPPSEVAPQAQGSGPSLHPDDVARIVQRRHERLRRLRAD